MEGNDLNEREGIEKNARETIMASCNSDSDSSKDAGPTRNSFRRYTLSCTLHDTSDPPAKSQSFVATSNSNTKQGNMNSKNSNSSSSSERGNPCSTSMSSNMNNRVAFRVTAICLILFHSVILLHVTASPVSSPSSAFLTVSSSSPSSSSDGKRSQARKKKDHSIPSETSTTRTALSASPSSSSSAYKNQNLAAPSSLSEKKKKKFTPLYNTATDMDVEEKKVMLQSSIHINPIQDRPQVNGNSASKDHVHNHISDEAKRIANILGSGVNGLSTSRTATRHQTPRNGFNDKMHVENGKNAFNGVNGNVPVSMPNGDEVKLKLTSAINNVLKSENNKRPKIQSSIPHKSSLASSRTNDSTINGSTVVDINKKLTIRSLWKKRNARSIEEGIRRERVGEKSTTEQQLSEILEEHSNVDLFRLREELYEKGGNLNKKQLKKKKKKQRGYVSKTIAGLISALAEEATGLEVEVNAREDTPLWGKHVDDVKIQFSRLEFQALRMGGVLDEALRETGQALPPNAKESMADSLVESGNGDASNSVDDVFDRIDVDNSGTLDAEELGRALRMASGLPGPDLEGASEETKLSGNVLSKLASRLVGLYDVNGDGVVDRDEYRQLVEDMTVVRDAQRLKQKEREEKRQERLGRRGFRPLQWAGAASRTFGRIMSGTSELEATNSTNVNEDVQQKTSEINGTSRRRRSKTDSKKPAQINIEGVEDISDDPAILDPLSKGEVVFTGLKLDLRRLLFGAVPVVKKITPGGPLILEPFTMTVSGCFSREDIMDSALLDDGLRRLVARALRLRVRSLRDLLDGAVFYGRSWNMASKQAPVVEVPCLTNIEFDNRDRLIITGRARIRTSPDQPVVENSFKLRTRLGTSGDGQYIRLEDPELALVLECPKAWERNIVSACKRFDLPVPVRPEPLYRFIPLVSKKKKTDQDGFNLGEDNRITSIYIKDNALRFDISAVLRPGRFLGNHYLAFTIPNRTFIITMDRIKEGIRNARRNKRELERSKKEQENFKKVQANDRYNRAVAQAMSSSANLRSNAQDLDLSYKKEFDDDDLKFADPANNYDDDVSSKNEGDVIDANRPKFLGRFLEGYLEAAREETERERNERLTTAISEFFGSPNSYDESNESSTLPPTEMKNESKDLDSRILVSEN